jgi:hypothetical protein
VVHGADDGCQPVKEHGGAEYGVQVQGHVGRIKYFEDDGDDENVEGDRHGFATNTIVGIVVTGT